MGKIMGEKGSAALPHYLSLPLNLHKNIISKEL
jgi:hypothetical protein